MPRRRKFLEGGEVLDVGMRCREGLPFVATPYMRDLLKGVLARAQALYPVTICNKIIMANHLHMIIIVEDPEDFIAFIRHFKTNSAKMINALLGRIGPFWDYAYEARVVLTPEMLVNRLTYFYTNPQTAGLVETIDEYPQASSWFATKNKIERHTEEVGLCSIGRLPAVRPGKLNSADLAFYQKEVEQSFWSLETLITEPTAGFKALGCDTDKSLALLEQVVSQVRQVEEDLAEQRAQEKERVMGWEKLVFADMHRPWIPKKRSISLLCCSTDVKLSVAYHRRHKTLSESCVDAWAQWLVGNYVDYPDEAFWPRRPRTPPD